MVLTDETLERIARLSQEGLSVRGIAAQLGLSKSSVARGLSQVRERAAAAAPSPAAPAPRAEVSRSEVARGGPPVARTNT